MMHIPKPLPLLTLLLGVGILGSNAAFGQDPNEPGVLDSVIQNYLGRPWRLPSSDQVTFNSEQINIVGQVKKKRADLDVSAGGHPITNTDHPSRSLADGLADLEDAAANNLPASMVLAAQELRSILLGTTQGRIYDGFAMLNYDRGAWMPDHVAGEYKTKRLSDRGRKVQGLDGRMRTVWEADITLLYYDEEIDSDTFLLVVPVDADFRDTVQLNYTIYSTSKESFVPSTLLRDVSPFGEGHLSSKGFDAAWVPLGKNQTTRISIDHGALGVMRGIQIWSWRHRPNSSQYMELVREEPAPLGGVRYEVRGAALMELLRGLDLDSIGSAAPEKKILAVADAAIAGATPANILAMLQQSSVQPLGTSKDWITILKRKDLFPVEALQILALEGINPKVIGPNRLGPYDAVLVYVNHEIYSTSLDLEGHNFQTGFMVPLPGDAQGETWKVKVINLDATTHYLQSRDYGPPLHDDIEKCDNAPSGEHSLEIYVDQAIQGAPKMEELQWRVGWGLRDGLGVLEQYDIFLRLEDQLGLGDFLDQFGQVAAGWQWPSADRLADFRVDPPMEWLGPSAITGLSEGGSPGVVIGTETPGFGVARMPFTDLASFHPDGLLNTDTDQDGVLDALLFPAWLRNPSLAGGDLIPSVPMWEPFLYLNPANGTVWLDPNDHGLGPWANQTFVFGEPIGAGVDTSFTMRRPRALGQALWHYDGLFRDNAGTPTRTSDRFTR